jgi:hypothetical protein
MDDSLLRRWAATWERAGKELTEIERRELQAMTDDQARAAAIALLSMPLPPDLPERLTSGLVEQQRWFAKLRAR